MNFSNEKDMKELIEEWKKESQYIQERNIRLAKDKIDLKQLTDFMEVKYARKIPKNITDGNNYSLTIN